MLWSLGLPRQSAAVIVFHPRAEYVVSLLFLAISVDLILVPHSYVHPVFRLADWSLLKWFWGQLARLPLDPLLSLGIACFPLYALLLVLSFSVFTPAPK